jgi:hypothetical protein
MGAVNQTALGLSNQGERFVCLVWTLISYWSDIAPACDRYVLAIQPALFALFVHFALYCLRYQELMP